MSSEIRKSHNDILDGGAIIYNKCKNKIDTILIEGDLSSLLNKDAEKSDSETTVTISRHCVSDSSKNFTITNGKIRKHGQSTLNYPIASMKIWSNKSATDGVNPVIELSALQTAMGLNKNRYVMKDNAIPANKWVLQANYADSSGANNGAIERLLQKTWYNAVINGEHKLRTWPQLFASGETVNHNDEELGETGANSWVEGYGTDAKGAGKTWADIATKPFPYQIRTSPESFPCAVFYRNTNGLDTSIHFLGQYVFMDDKKSDHLYGERSIYHHYDESDPFCLKIENSDLDKKENRVWNNKDVVRIEVVLLDNVLTSFMNYNVPKSANDNVNQGASVPCDAIKYDSKGNKLNFYWEDYFEMIYPDPDDLTVKVNGVKVTEDKFAQGSQFREKAQKFLDFLQWITDIAVLNQGAPLGTVTTAALNEFKATAAQHLDLWKVAAYYIFFLRFGLVDSVERNAQLKTYDGQHWHYEPWDADIAVGNKNDGGFAFDPPINRNSKLPLDQTKYAYSGRSISTSNTLWDCLEAWDYWMDTVVPKVAQALYTAGLSYDAVVKMFDEEYSNKWCETLYNKSGHYKYVEMRGGDDTWLRWLQGASISHRHWWLSVSMNYYDAMWTAGDFNNHRVYIAAEKTSHSAGTDIVVIKPSSNTFFKMTQNDGNSSLGLQEATRDNPAEFDVSAYSFSVKDPTHIYGATFIEELDLSCFAQKLSSLTLGGAYDRVLGAPIKVLNVGIPMTKVSNGENNEAYGLGAVWSGNVSGTQLNLSGSSTDGGESFDGLANLRSLDITGQQSIQNTMSLLYNNNRRMLQNFYAIGTGLTSFVTSRSGNRFGILRLPSKTVKTPSGGGTAVESSKLLSMTLIDSTWDELSFWTTETSTDVISRVIEGDNGEEITIIEANPATFTNTGIPASMHTIIMQGSTASNLCAATLVMGWIEAIKNDVAANLNNPTEEELETALLERLNDYTLHAENIRWGTSDVSVSIYYKDLARLAAFNQGNNQNANLKGYVRILDSNPMTSIQLTQLREWFGNGVFNKSNMQSGLIVDQDANYVRISVGGDAVVINGRICLTEGRIATLSATKFLLSEDTEEYEWSFSVLDMEDNALSGAPISLVCGADGITRLVTDEGSVGDYKVVVSVTSVGGVSESVTIYITGVTYPDDWTYGVSGDSIRPFNTTVRVATKIFGSGNAGNICYVIGTPMTDMEFYIEPVNGSGKTATLKDIKYMVQCLDTEGGMELTSYTELHGGTSALTDIDYEGDNEYLFFSRDSLHNGIALHTVSNVPSVLKRYILTCVISIGGKTVRRYMNLILMNDSVDVVSYNVTNPLYTILRSAIDPTLTRGLYKSDLMAIDGALDFSDSSISNFVTNNVDGGMHSIFKYLPNVTALDFSDCTALDTTDPSITDTIKRVFVFDIMTDLTSVIFNGATVVVHDGDDSVLDFTYNEYVANVDLRGTELGVKFVENSRISSLQLGAPKKVSITRPRTLSTMSVTSHANLVYVELVQVNKSSNYGYTIFDSIMN